MNEELIFERAIAIADPDARSAFISDSCNGDVELVQKINRLVNAHLNKGSFMSNPAGGSAMGLRLDHSIDQVEAKPGDQIGPFELQEQIGEGGMAIVFRARQTESISRNVAIKLIKPGLETRQVLQRMQLERQALAMMNHPGIANVYDAGVTEGGRPYFAMELIEGSPITSFCHEHHLNSSARIQLLIDACEAVEHAHRRGIVHRDLKPANLFVTSDGRIKIIDFGIAKVVGDEIGADQALTQLGQAIGTPQYMSPEQAAFRNEQIDTRTDVYGLGTILYELLTGNPPFSGQTQTELLSKIVSQEPVKPSRMNREIDRDLETVILKALHKSVDQRYGSARELADDLTRLNQGLPVHARRASTLERVIKWAKRSKAAAALIVVSAIGLIALSATWASFTWELKKQRDTNKQTADRLQIEKDLADRNFEKAHHSIRKYLDALVTHTPLGSSKQLAYQKQIFEIGSEFYDELIRSDDTLIDLNHGALERIERVRLERAKLYLEYTKVLETDGQLDEAVECLDFVLAESEQLSNSQSTGIVDAAQSLLASATGLSARLRLAKREYVSARKDAESAIAMITGNRKLAPDYRTWYLASNHNRSGMANRFLGRREEAKSNFQTAIELADSLPEIPDFQLTRSQARLQYVRLLNEMRQLTDAKKYVSQAIEILTPISQSRILNTPRYESLRIECLFELAKLQKKSGNSDSFEATMAKVVASQSTLVTMHPDVEDFQFQQLGYLEAQHAWAVDSQTKEQAHERIREIESAMAATTSTPEQLLSIVRMRMNHVVKAKEQFRFDFGMRQTREIWSLLERIPADYLPDVTLPLRDMIRTYFVDFSFAQIEFTEAVDVNGQFEFTEQNTIIRFAVCHAAVGDIAFARKLSKRFERELPNPVTMIGFLPVAELLVSTRSQPLDSSLFQSAVNQMRRMFDERASMYPFQRIRYVSALCHAIEIIKTRSVPDEFNSDEFIEWAREAAVTCIVGEQTKLGPGKWAEFESDVRFSDWLQMPEFQRAFAGK